MPLFLRKIFFAVIFGAFITPNSVKARPTFYQGQFSEAELVQLLNGKQDKIEKLEKDRKWIRLEAVAVSGAFCFLIGYCLAKWRST